MRLGMRSICLVLVAVALVVAASACGKQCPCGAERVDAPQGPAGPGAAAVADGRVEPAPGQPAAQPPLAAMTPDAFAPIAQPVVAASLDGSSGDHAFRLSTVAGFAVGVLRADRPDEFAGRQLGPAGEVVDGIWEPSLEELRRFLGALPAALETAGRDPRGAGVAARLRAEAAGGAPDARGEAYRVQVVGLLVAGRKFVFANFFCEGGGLGERWEDTLVQVLDGGDCYLEAWFDVASGEFPRWFINGEA